MVKFAIFFLTSLAIIVSGDAIKVPDNVAVSSDVTTKVKRYYNHDVSPHKSPCPPFYPHLHEPKSPMHLTRPYGPPAYPKPMYGPPPMPLHHAQIIHQPTYAAYNPKQTISYVKPHIPIAKPDYHYLPSKPQQIIHQTQPIHHAIQQQAQWQYHQPQQNYQKPHFAYAPIYHKPMINYQKPIAYAKPVNYHAHPMPRIVYKMESTKCAPCHEHQVEHSQPIQQHYQTPQIIHVKPIQPVHHPSPMYLPISHGHAQSTVIKSNGHVAPCIK